MSERSRRRRIQGFRLGLPVTIFVLGLLSILMLIGANWMRDRRVLQEFGRITAVGEIQRNIATAHLWLEELLSGDLVNLEDIFGYVTSSEVLVNTLLEGGRIGEDRYLLEPLEPGELRDRTLALRERLDRFTRLSVRRQEGLSSGADVGIGSDLDEEYDHLFRELTAEAIELDLALSDQLIEHYARARMVFRALLLAWCGALLLAIWGLASRERRRMRAEVALAESREELFQARKIEAVGRLTGGIAHDINNFLAAINAQCERVLIEADLEARSVERIERVIATAFKASSLIQRLLAFSRRQPIRLETVQINELVVDLQKMTRVLGEDIESENGLAPNLWTVEIDPTHLEQVVVNLIINASEAMPTGGRLAVSTANEELTADHPAGLPAGEYVRLSVRDTGQGIPKEIRDKIFEPFFTTRERSGGTGLGLATVYGIVTQAGGAIRVESQVGKGTTFSLWLPRGGEEKPPVPLTGEAGARKVRGVERILLVDDNVDFLEATRDVLHRLGFEVDVAATAQQARGLIDGSSGGYALLISDVVMPDANGPEVARWIRQRWPEQKVLFVSGSPDRLTEDHGLRQNEFEVLVKPFTTRELAQRIRYLIDHS